MEPEPLWPEPPWVTEENQIEPETSDSEHEAKSG